MNTPGERILVVGTGAMACLFAARLAAAGTRVILLGTWQESLRALNTSGVRYIDQQGHEHVFPVEATDDPEKCVGIQFALVLVKSHQTKRAARQLSECLSEDGLALTLQNGLDNKDVLAAALGSDRVEAGVTTLGATMVAPGVVRHGGEGVISIAHNERVKPLIEILRHADFEVEIVENPESLLWGKLVINAAINPLTAILKVQNGRLLTNEPARSLLGLLAEETAAVAGARGVELPYSNPTQVVESVARRTSENYSSMFKDILRGSLTEVDAINGAIVRIGDEDNLPVQLNRAVWLLVKAVSADDGQSPGQGA
jgi:2-dehydropantoate 2-reductase